MEFNIENTVSLIEDYHNSPELWNPKITVYKDNKVKHDKLKQLAIKYECSVINLKKKIKNLRSAFHRERKKLQKLNKDGSSPTKGKWFAYELLSFLLDVDVPRKSMSAISDGEDSEVEDDFVPDTADTPEIILHDSSRHQHSQFREHDGNKQSNSEEESKISLSPKKKMRKNKCSISSSDCEEETYDILKCAVHRDDCATYGEYVGNELRKLPPEVQTVVKHLVNNVFFKAAMGKYNDEYRCSTLDPRDIDESSNELLSEISVKRHPNFRPHFMRLARTGRIKRPTTSTRTVQRRN